MQGAKWAPFILLLVSTLAAADFDQGRTYGPGTSSQSMLLDPHAVPVTEPWLEELPENYPLFYKAETVGTVEASEGHPVGETWIVKQYDGPAVKMAGSHLVVGPMHIRLKTTSKGPWIQIAHHSLKKTVDVLAQFEIGVFGDTQRRLNETMRKNNVPCQFGLIAWDIHLKPLDTVGPNSLYESFQEVNFSAGDSEEDCTGVDNRPASGVMAESTVQITLTPIGAQLLDESLKKGSYNLPMIAQVWLGETAAPEHMGNWENHDVPFGPTLSVTHASINILTMMVPGGLACLTQDFWGNPIEKQSHPCSSYWNEGGLAGRDLSRTPAER